MIGSISPIAVATILNNAGNYEIQTTAPHGLPPGTVTVSGCRDASGIPIAGLNGTYAITVIDSTHLGTSIAYASGYAFGGSIWPNNGQLTAATMTGFDSALATRVADKTGDVLFGQYNFRTSPSIVASGVGSKILTTVSGASIATTSPSFKYVLGDNDDTQLLPPRTRTIMISPAEIMNEYGAESLVFGEQLTTAMGGVGVADGVTVTTPGTYWIPLTRLHNGATLLRATLLFFPSPFLATFALPTIFPTIQVFRLNPSTDVALTSLSAAGAAVFPVPSTAAAYAQTPAVGATGSITLATLNFGTASLRAGSTLFDAASNTFEVTASGTYANGAPVPIRGIATSASPSAFYGANTNHSAGDTLTWSAAPTNCLPAVPVSTGGLTGGLNAGYAQSLVFTPDAGMGLIDQSTYVYILKVTDDDVASVNGFGGINTLHAGIRIDLSGITSLAPQ